MSTTPTSNALIHRMAVAAKQDIHSISLLVNDKPGVLVRVALVFARRGFNINSLVVSSAAHEGFSRITLTCQGSPTDLEQINKQLDKLIDVIHSIDHTHQRVIEVEVALFKVSCGLDERTQVLQIAQHYNAKVVDFGPESLILRVYGSSDKLNTLIDVLEPFELIELVRSGKIVMARGKQLT